MPGRRPRSARGEIEARDVVQHVLGLTTDIRELVVRLGDEEGLNPSLLQALQYLPISEPCSQRELAECMRMDASSVTDLVNRLESTGHVRRTVDPDDRRIRRIVLTNAGQALRNEIFERIVVESPLNGLTRAEQRQLRDLLAKVVEPLEWPCEFGATGVVGRTSRALGASTR